MSKRGPHHEIPIGDDGNLAVLAIGYYIYSAQIGKATNGSPVAQQIDLVAIKSDLLSIAQSERYYLATYGSYATLEQLRQSGNVSSLPENRRGYVYGAEVDGVCAFPHHCETSRFRQN